MDNEGSSFRQFLVCRVTLDMADNMYTVETVQKICKV